MSTASCGQMLNDEAIRVGVGIRLGLPLCVRISAAVILLSIHS